MTRKTCPMSSDALPPRSAPLSRRQFLATSAGAGLGLAALPLALGAAAPEPAPVAPAPGPRLKTSLNAFSFLELLNANAKDPAQGIDLFRVCTFCAEQGFDGVDVTGYFFPGYPGIPADDYLIRLKRHVFDLGLGFSGTGVRNDFTAADPAVRAGGVARIKAWIEVAAKLGAPTVRAFADSQPPFKDWTEAARGASRDTVEGWVADALRECAVHGARWGVIVAVQNHGDFIASGAEHLHLIGRVNHAWCAPLVDTGKYLTADPYADIALVAPHAVNWQIKETTQSTLTSPRVDLPRLAGIIRRSGYRGYLPIETLRMGRADYDSFQAIAALLAELRAALAANG
jgi:sugar phosphate isomerase/epimerase